MARVRVAATAFVAAQAWLYQPPSGLTAPFPMWALPLSVGAAALAITLLGWRAARAERLRVVRLGAVLEVLADAGIVLGMLFAFSFDQYSQLWAIMVLPTIEAAWRLGLRGALLTWGGLAVGYAGRHLWAAHSHDYIDVAVDSISYRTGLVLTVTLAAGLLARSMRQATAAHAQLARRARTDALTEVPNRDHFLDELAADLERGRGGAVVFIDLDGFKTVNNTLGHETGDHLLKAVAGRLLSRLRDGDRLARFGGDEFTVLLRDLSDPAEVEEVARHLQAALASPFDVGGRRVNLSATVGVAIARGDHTDPNLVLRDADLAMYEAKSTGRGALASFSPPMAAQLHRRMTLEHNLRAALEQGQLGVAYQPIVRLDTGAVAGVEALLRWSDPTHGRIPPEEVVDLAADMGIGVELGNAVMEAACRDIARWRATRPELFVTVNLGGGQVSDAEASLRQVSAALDRFGVPAEALMLEVTETALLDAANLELLNLLGEVRRQGVRVAMDDFGKGYSSLARLRHLEVDILKLDKGLTAELAEPGRDPIVLESVVDLAHRLELAVVAEGVETVRQAEALTTARCEYVQGYFYGRPTDAATTSRLLTGSPPSPLLADADAEGLPHHAS